MVCFTFTYVEHLAIKRRWGYDIQRLDIGIAMCHFEIMIQELGFTGKWIDQAPDITLEKNTEYIISYIVE